MKGIFDRMKWEVVVLGHEWFQKLIVLVRKDFSEVLVVELEIEVRIEAK